MTRRTFPKLRDRAVFKPAAGKWGEGGATLITLAETDGEVAGEALTLAWQNTAPKSR